MVGLGAESVNHGHCSVPIQRSIVLEILLFGGSQKQNPVIFFCGHDVVRRIWRPDNNLVEFQPTF
jgi:hypothetical protein